MTMMMNKLFLNKRSVGGYKSSQIDSDLAELNLRICDGFDFSASHSARQHADSVVQNISFSGVRQNFSVDETAQNTAPWGKDHCTAGLQFDFDWILPNKKICCSLYVVKLLNPNMSNRRPDVQWYCYLWEVFSGYIFITQVPRERFWENLIRERHCDTSVAKMTIPIHLKRYFDFFYDWHKLHDFS